MTIKEKFNSIDQSKLNADQKGFLEKIKNVTKDFTVENKEVNDKVEGALDKMIATFKEKMPEVIKTTEKKEPTKKASTKKAPAEKKEKVPTGKKTVMTLAKEIRKEGESWKDAQARARKQMKEDSESATKTMKTELQKLQDYIKEHKELKGMGKTTLLKDASRTALPSGRRVSHKGWKNQYGTSDGGKVYYERRENRRDRLAPNYPQGAPKLANGGGVNNKRYTENFNVGKVKYLVSYFDGIKKHNDGSNFYDIALFKNKKDFENFVSKLQKEGYKRLSWNESYADGGDVNAFTLRMVKGNAGTPDEVRTEEREIAFANGGMMNNMSVHEGTDFFNTPVYSRGGDFMSGAYGEEGLEVEETTYTRNKDGIKIMSVAMPEKELTEAEWMAKHNESPEARAYAVGGGIFADTFTGETGTHYTGLVGETNAMSSGEMFADGGAVMQNQQLIADANMNPVEMFGREGISAYKRGGMLTPSQRYVQEIKGLTGLSQKAIEDYISENKLSNDEVLNIVIGLGRKQIERSDVSTAMIGKKDNAESKKLLSFAKSNKALAYAVGGGVFSDAFTGYTGTHYTGLVGETNAMSSGEMFADGGGVGMTKSIGLLYNKTTKASKDSGDVVYLNSENINLDGYTNLKPYSVKASDEEIKIGFSIPNQKTMVYFSNETTKKSIDRTSFEKYNGSIYIEEPLTEKIATDILKKIKFFEKYVDGGNINERDRGYVNHDQDYEVRYAREHSSRHGYGNIKYHAGGNLHRHGLEEGDEIIKTIGGFQKVKDKKGNVVYVDLQTGYRDSQPPLPFKEGGAFEKLSNKVAERYEGDAVAPKYQRMYGKRYDKEEAKEVGDKVAGKVKAMQMKDKKALGGNVGKIYIVEYIINGIKKTTEYFLYENDRVENILPKNAEILSVKEKKAFGGLFGKSEASKTKHVNLDEKQVRLNSGEWVQVIDQTGDSLMVMDLSKIGMGAEPKRVKISDVDMTSFMSGGKVAKKKPSVAKKETVKRGSNPNVGQARKKANSLAQEIRKEGEAWASALKRAYAELRLKKQGVK